MIKNNILVTISLVLLVGLILLSGCARSFGETNFEVYNIGDHFNENRDGYLIKLNDLFFANITYKNDKIEIYKLRDSYSTDYLGNSELYYSDIIDECFCNNNNIVVYAEEKDEYTVIDCNDKNRMKKSLKTDVNNIDFDKFTKVIFS